MEMLNAFVFTHDSCCTYRYELRVVHVLVEKVFQLWAVVWGDEANLVIL